MNKEEYMKSVESLEKFGLEVEEETAKRKLLAEFRQTWYGRFAYMSVFLVFSCFAFYVWVEFIKLCQWAGQYTWP